MFIPDDSSQVDAMPDGPEKLAAKAALPPHTAESGPSDATAEFDRVNAAIDAARVSGGAALVHCAASISRSAVFLLGYIMKDQGVSLAQAVQILKAKWEAAWPNDQFIQQLLAYEKRLAASN